MFITEPILGKLTQGAIFNCAKAERYVGSSVHGIVITARCDLAHDKIPLVTYLPIVSLGDWLSVDGCDLLEDRTRKEFVGNRNGILRSLGIAASIAESQTLQAICDAFFPAESSEKSIRNGRAKLLPLIEMDEKFRDWQRSEYNIDWLYSASHHIKKSIVRDVCQHKLSGYYFIPQIYTDDGSPGYVILMREITNLSSETAAAVGAGLMFSPSDNVPQGLARSSEMSMPVAELTSPAIEHLLQSFSTLYGRIGLTDIPPSYVENMCEVVPSKRIHN